MNLRNAHVVITGASGGIGACLARELSNRGARLTLVARDEIKLQQLVSSLPGNHCAVAVDLCAIAGRKTLVEKLRHERPVDLLINNAAVSDLAMYESQSEQRIKQIIDTNLLMPLLLTQIVMPLLNPTGSQILNIGSTFGSIGYPGYASYCASKFGLRGFTESLRRELADTNVTVQYAAPRATRTLLNTNAANTLNTRLGNHTDEPRLIAEILCSFIESGRSTLYIGWPEKLFVRLNAVLNGVVDRAIQSKLTVVKQTIQELQQ